MKYTGESTLLNSGSTIGRCAANEIKPDTVTSKLRRTLDIARGISGLSDKLAYRVAGPRPEPLCSASAPSSPDDDEILSRVADELDSIVRQIGDDVEYAIDRV